ncbi:Fidgetin-like protein 1 [Allomyces arbusculus]|nr:Fidgetin-like protein 1 [Allomyces arbusculus]
MEPASQPLPYHAVAAVPHDAPVVVAPAPAPARNAAAQPALPGNGFVPMTTNLFNVTNVRALAALLLAGPDPTPIPAAASGTTGMAAFVASLTWAPLVPAVPPPAATAVAPAPRPTSAASTMTDVPPPRADRGTDPVPPPTTRAATTQTDALLPCPGTCQATVDARLHTQQLSKTFNEQRNALRNQIADLEARLADAERRYAEDIRARMMAVPDSDDESSGIAPVITQNGMRKRAKAVAKVGSGFMSAKLLNHENLVNGNGGKMIDEGRSAASSNGADPCKPAPYFFNNPTQRSRGPGLTAPSGSRSGPEKRGSFGPDGGGNGGKSDKEKNGKDGGVSASAAALAEKIKNVDARIIEMIENEILDNRSAIAWDDIAGLEAAKQAIREIVIWPMQRPDLFAASSLRRPSKGVLLFGPPGTGKTMIARCIASQVDATFFSISASSLTSKWVGEGEKMVRGLFAVARAKQPSVVFIDEIDSLLTSRSEGEQESSRRIKTEFLVQFDGAATDADDRILVVGATNRPQELDEAARRRFKKRLYIPLPCASGRRHLLSHLLRRQAHAVTSTDLESIVRATEGYSGSDLTALCEEAAMMSVREIPPTQFASVNADGLRPITAEDLRAAQDQVRPSVARADVEFHERWNDEFGSKVAAAVAVVVPRKRASEAEEEREGEGERGGAARRKIVVELDGDEDGSGSEAMDVDKDKG